jgi:hypothetical protein
MKDFLGVDSLGLELDEICLEKWIQVSVTWFDRILDHSKFIVLVFKCDLISNIER